MGTDDYENLPAVRALLSEVDTLEEFARTYQVTTAEQYSAGAEDLKRVKAAQKCLEDERTGITGPLNAALKRVNNLFRTPGDRLARIERAIKQRLGDFADEQERLRREEQRKADEVARKDRERIEAQAAKAAAAGKTEKAEQLQERAASVVAPVVHRDPPKVAGLSSREVWKFEVVDPAQVPREWCAVDESKIRRQVAATRGETKIPGVRVYAERQLAAASA